MIITLPIPGFVSVAGLAFFGGFVTGCSVALRDRDSQKAERMPGVQGFTLLSAQLVLDFTKYNVAEKCENCFDPMKYMK